MKLIHINIDSLAYFSTIGDYYVLDDVKEEQAINGKPFVTGQLSDASGSISFVMQHDCALNIEDTGKIIYAEGAVEKNKDALQAKLFCVHVAEGNEIDLLDIDTLIPVAPIDLGAAYYEIGRKLIELSDSPYAKVALELFLEHSREVHCCPADKSVHYSFVGGWMMHVLNMLRMAEHVCDEYGDTYPINRALLYSGVVLHDIGKLKDCTLNESRLVHQYSIEGKLLGHAVLGMLVVDEKAKALGLSKGESAVLEHLILSHHGKVGFGAAIEPLCIEAQILAYLDGLDSRMEIYRCTLEQTEHVQFSDLEKTLKRSVYRV